MDAVASLLISRDINCKRYSALAIGNLAMEPKGRARVLGAGEFLYVCVCIYIYIYIYCLEVHYSCGR